MIWLLIIVGLLLIGFGVIGSVAPILPGPIIAYIALLLSFFFNDATEMSTTTIVVLGIICLIITVLDNFLPILSTKKFGGSKEGVWGGVIGLIIGMFFPPVGIILGPLFGAIVGELIGGNTIGIALKSGIGSFIGFVIGTIIKLSFCIVAAVYFMNDNIVHVKNLISSIF